MAAKLPGILLMIAAVVAALSGEPATRTNQGVMAIALCFILGVVMLADAVAKSKSKRAVSVAQQAPPPQSLQPQATPVAPATPAQKMSNCPHCGKEVAEDFVACPHCGTALKTKCPNCGKWLNPEFIACPYCGTSLTQKPEPEGQ